MRKRRSSQGALSLALILCSAGFAYYARINGLPDGAVAVGATIISAVLLGLFWRQRSRGGDD